MTFFVPVFWSRRSQTPRGTQGPQVTDGAKAQRLFIPLAAVLLWAIVDNVRDDAHWRP